MHLPTTSNYFQLTFNRPIFLEITPG